jgi:hypothetical protein
VVATEQKSIGKSLPAQPRPYSMPQQYPGYHSWPTNPPAPYILPTPSPILQNLAPENKDPKACPDSLKQYIARAFKKCTSDEERNYMQKVMTDIITRAKNEGRFLSQDWDHTELPPLPRELHFMHNNPEASRQAEKVMESYRQQERKPKRKSRFEIADVEEEVKKRTKIESEISTFEAKKKSKFSSDDHEDRIAQRKSRFQDARKPKDDYQDANNFHTKKKHDEKLEEIIKDAKIVGTCTDIEKHYYRLTSLPDPSTVRPEPILRKALSHFKSRWRKGEIDYAYFSNQLRSIRQDLTVQQIKDKFTVEVYQVHTRLAIEANDLDQFSSCIGRLFELFKEGLRGKKTVTSTQEFLAYRIIYYTLQYIFIQLEKSLKQLTPGDYSCPEIQHALSIKTAFLEGNYHQVFKLRASAPNMGIHLIDMFTPKLRVLALLKMCKAYVPTVPLSFVSSELGFPSIESCKEFLIANEVVLQDEEINCKDSLTVLRNSTLLQKKL